MQNIHKTERKAHKFHMLAGNSLISVSQLCDSGCEVIFHHDKVTVTKDSKKIAEVYRDLKTTLWIMPITTPKAKNTHTNNHMRTPTAQINSVIQKGTWEK